MMNIVIIGANAAGMSAAAKLRRGNKDAQIIVFEKTGETSYGACGLPYFISGLNETSDLLRIRKSDAFIRSGIDVRLFHTVTAIDSVNQRVTVFDETNGTSIVQTYDELIISSGSSPVMPPIPGINLDHVFCLKTIQDAEKIRDCALKTTIQNVVIVGAGYIGLELAESFVLLNKNVRMIEMAPRPMLVMDEDYAPLIEKALTQHSVILQTSERVISLEGDGRIHSVITDRGTYQADLVVISIGTRPNTAFLAGSGLNMLKNGAIVVDNQMRTNLPHVYAAGDCATITNRLTGQQVYLPLGTNANKQGKVLAQNLLGTEKRLLGALGTSMCRVIDLELARTGLNVADATVAGINCAVVTADVPNKPPYYPGGCLLHIKLFYEADSHVILGAQISGHEGAASRIGSCAVAIEAGMTMEQLALTDFGYAPPFSHVWDPIQVTAGLVG